MSQGASMPGRATAIPRFPCTESVLQDATPEEQEYGEGRTMKVLRLLPVAVAMGLLVTGSARAEGLLELYDAARAYDANWQSAKAQYDANIYRAEQARAGLLPQASLSAGLTRSTLETNVNGAPVNP